MYDELFDSLNEATFDTIRRKHRSIKRLFPDFDFKTKGVENKGGLKLVKQDSTRWMFKVHSGTEDDLWYDNTILFRDVQNVLKKVVMNRRLWAKGREGVDMRAVSKEFMKRVEVEVHCTCPAFKYWGSAYILSLSKYSAQYSMEDPENRAPKIRNPRQYGSVCKHLDRVLKVMGFYTSTLMTWLREFYQEDITRWEEAAMAHTKMFKDLGDELGKRKDGEEPEPRGDSRPADEPMEEPVEDEEIEDTEEDTEDDDKQAKIMKDHYGDDDDDERWSKASKAHAAMSRNVELDKEKRKKKGKRDDRNDDEGRF